ncbi:5-formyltetrahydrofolate cyclo-ligase [Candidatus Roizmanbacteria bacterium]|nr:5-formyltetrahydrofolate cyclo-ligase [Candidatus Roizmanbacteria bacterium]
MDRLIGRVLLSRKEIHDATNVCIYASFSEEVDTRKLIRILLNKRKTVTVPKIVGSDLELRQINSIENLESGTFGILEPKPACPLVDPTLVDVFIVPGVMFDRKGNRRGRGKGYYDRLLKGAKAIKIGLAYSFQVVPRLPHKKYDIPMDIIITENETITP